MKILTLSDTHIGAGYEHRKDALADTSRVLDHVVGLAVEHQVDLVLHGGDVFHRSKPSPAELHVFKRFCRQLEAARIPMVALLGNGNHEAPLGQPTALELFESRLVRTSRKPEVITEFANVAVCTLPAVPVHNLTARSSRLDRSEINSNAVDLLLQTARDLFVQAPDDRPRILAAHWLVSGASLPTGLAIQEEMGVVLPIHELEAIGFDALVFGDVHKPQILGGDAGQFYCGSPMCNDFGESNDQHGVRILGFLDRELESSEFKPLADRRFVTVDVDLAEEVTERDLGFGESRAELGVIESDGAEVEGQSRGPGNWPNEPSRSVTSLDETDLIAAAIIAAPPLKAAILRVRYTATEEQHRRVDTKALDRLIEAAGVHRLYGGYQWIPVRESRARVELSEDRSPLSMLDLWISAQGLSGSEGDSLRALTERLLGQL